MLLGCLPSSSGALRRFFAAASLVLIGYVARAATESSLGAGAAGGSGAAAAARAFKAWA